MDRTRRGLRVSILSLLLLLLAAIPAAAQVSWAVAEREDAQIQSLISKLLPYVADLPGEGDAAGVILFRQEQYDLESAKTRFCSNLLIQVRDPGALPDRLASPWTEAGLKIESQFGVIVRGDDVIRLDEGSATFEPGQEEIGRGRCVFDWGDLRENDILGWSFVGEAEGPVPAMSVPAADVFPTVIANLTIQGNGRFAYRVGAKGLDRSELKLKESEVLEGRPSVWKASVNARAAVPDAPARAPYPDTFPHIDARLEHAWFEPPDNAPMVAQWVPTGGWNRSVLILASMLDQAARNAGNLDIVLAAITSGKATDEAKEQAVFQYVRDNIRLLSGPEYSETDMRDLELVMKSKEATEAEKVALMAVMLRELELPATVALLREPALGELDRGDPTIFQFTDLAVRCGTDTPRFYAPQCAECTDRTIPAAWNGAQALSGLVDLTSIAEKKNEEWRKEAIAKGSINVAAMQQTMEKEPWHRFEALGD